MKLEDLVSDEQDRVHIYALILDCSAPYYLDPTAKYLCTLKLIDESVNPEAGGTQGWFSATIFAKTADELPRANKVGTVARIHRGQTKRFKGSVQLNCDVNIKGAWVLFDPKDGVTPIAKSGKQHTFTTEDRTLLGEIRDFGRRYFAKHELAAITLAEAARTKPKDFDTICFVLDLKKKGGVDRARLCDTEKVVKLDIPPGRNFNFSPHEVIRLRSANYFNDGSFRSLTLNEYSNILRVPENYKSARQLLEHIRSNKAAEDVRAQVALYTPHVSAPLVATKILNQHKHVAPVQLRSLFYGDAPKGTQKYFRVRASATEIGPKNPQEWICVVDKKTQKQSFCPG